MIPYAVSMIVVATGLYAVLMKDNVIKKLIGLAVFSNGIHLFLLSLGYRSGGIPPIITGLDFMRFASSAVDPLPQALILTSIVINLSVTAVGLSIAILLYRQFGTLDVKKIRSLRG